MAPKTRALGVLVGTPHEVLEYTPGQDHFGEHSARELGLDPRTVFKTLVIEGPARELAVCCVPVAARLSLKNAAAALGWKRAALAEPSRARHATGYVIGGISPLGTLKPLPTLLDASATALTALTVSAGRRGLSARLSPAALAELTGAQFADISSG